MSVRMFTPLRLRYMAEPVKPDGEPAADADKPDKDAAQSTGDDQGKPAEDEPIEGEDALGDKGKQAIERMKADKRAAIAAQRKAEEKAAALQAKIDGREAEYAAEQSRTAAARDAVRSLALRNAATGRVNPDLIDVLPSLIDVSTIDVGDNWDVDTEAIIALVDDLIIKRPALAASTQGQQQRFQGSADQGARKADTRTEEQQLTEQLAEANKTRNFAAAIQIKNRLAALHREKSA